MRIKSFTLVLLVIISLFSCKKENQKDDLSNIDFRQEMRDFVMEIGNYSQSFDADFIVIPQNGQELATNTGYANGTPQTAYLQSIDATGREDLFYGYTSDNESTPQPENEFMLGLCNICEQNGVEVLTIDYSHSTTKWIIHTHITKIKDIFLLQPTTEILETSPMIPFSLLT